MTIPELCADLRRRCDERERSLQFHSHPIVGTASVQVGVPDLRRLLDAAENGLRIIEAVENTTRTVAERCADVLEIKSALRGEAGHE